MVEFPFPLLTLLQPKSYPVPSMSVRIFTIPKLQNIRCWHFTSELSSLSSFFPLLSSSKIFLIYVIIFMLDLAHSSNRTGALGITSLVLFQLKRFFIYSGDQLVQNPLDVITVQNWWLICWRLLLSGLRSVLGNATDSLKPLRTNNPISSRDLVPSDQATCTTASGVNDFVSGFP